MTAMRPTLAVPVAAFLLGAAVCALAMSSRRSAQAAAEAEPARVEVAA